MYMDQDLKKLLYGDTSILADPLAPSQQCYTKLHKHMRSEMYI
jgi:hypothetical protein